MAGVSSLARTLRRQLLARGFTALPVCRACMRETPLHQWAKGAAICKACEFERAQEYEARQPEPMVDDGRDFPEKY